MNEPKFTPGPWELDGCEVKVPQMNGRLPTMEERLANAALIAAAPEMYAILVELDEIFKNEKGTIFVNKITEVLKKARGEKC